MSAPGMPPGPQMQGAPGPQHRSQQLHVQQQPQQGGPGSAVAQFHGPGASARLPELLEAIKAEFQTLADEMHVYKMQRDEYAETCRYRICSGNATRGEWTELAGFGCSLEHLGPAALEKCYSVLRWPDYHWTASACFLCRLQPSTRSLRRPFPDSQCASKRTEPNPREPSGT